MRPCLPVLALLVLAPALSGAARENSADWTAPSSPRLYVTAARRDAFKTWCATGEGAASFARLRAEFDAAWLSAPLPAEPQPYGTPFPANKDPRAVQAWRAAQRDASLLTGAGEAAVVLWLATDEPRYLALARAALLAGSRWAPDGAAGLAYNDEAAFRLWRKLPFLYDQLRPVLTDAERADLLPRLRAWGAPFFDLVHSDLRDTRRNSLDSSPRSHSVRFVATVGLAGLALLDDLPEARDWFAFAARWYRDQFPPWGGDDGGWSEGIRYWETGVASEPVRFQDALARLDHPDAWTHPFWRQTGYFAGYLLQPRPATSFGDISGTGKVNLDWKNARFLRKLARIFGDGHLRAFADLGEPAPPYPLALNNYPSGIEYLLSDFADADKPLPATADLSALPSARWFRDIGWVSLHSVLGRPAEDIMLTFISSPYGSFSHSHAAQNAFILSAWGEELAVNAGYREFHGSPHHDGYVRRTLSKNALLIGGEGQTPRSKAATGRILRLDAGDRFIWTTGDATAAYNAGRASPLADRVLRDIVFVDRRYFVIRDTVRLPQPRVVDWLLHSEKTIAWDAVTQTALLRNDRARLAVALQSLQGPLLAGTSDTWPVPPDPAWLARFNLATQGHLAARTAAPAREHEIVAVLWPSDADTPPPALTLTRDGDATLCTITRPDGATDRVTFAGSDRLHLD
ncbi:heparinase [Opitutaceae bacterium TAV5]|nr:heparinase [Opitutaceae bacterium TAV5]